MAATSSIRWRPSRTWARGAIHELVKVREEGGPFRSLSDFAKRLDTKVLNKRSLESLVKAGALDCINPHRAQVFFAIDGIISLSNRSASEQAAGQNDLFGGGAAKGAEELILPARDGWLPMERLAQEFEAVGFYLSGHPLDEYAKALNRMGVESYASFVEKVQSRGASAAKLAGTITSKQERRSKAGNRFAFIGFSDPTGQFEAICFSDTLQAARDLLEPGTSVIARIEADTEGEDIKLRLLGVESLERAAAQAVSASRSSSAITSRLSRLPSGFSLVDGRRCGFTVIEDTGREINISLGDRFVVTPQFRGALKAVQGVVDVQEL